MHSYFYEKSDILHEIDLREDNVIEASAGTGKTYTIEHLVVELLLGNYPVAYKKKVPVSIRDILLVTFTEKATAELKKKVRARIQSILEDDGTTTTEPGKSYWTIDEENKRLLQQALLDFESIAIYTIHGFCNRMLQEFAFENGQLFEQQQISNATLFPMVFRKYLRKHLIHNAPLLLQLYLEEKTIEDLELETLELLGQHGQRVPIPHNYESLRQSVVPSVMDLSNFLKSQSLQRSETNASWIVAEFEQMNLNMHVCKATLPNLHIVLNAVRQYQDTQDLIQFLCEISCIDLTKIINLQFKKTKAANKKYQSLTALPTEISQFLEIIDKLGEVLIKNPSSLAMTLIDQLVRMEEVQMIQQIPDYHKWVRILLLQKAIPALRTALENYKTEQGYFDFDDMLFWVEKGLSTTSREKGKSSLLMNAIRRKYTYALIDEFQDTDPVQWNIFKSVFLDSPEHRLFVIGDPKQAIYGFRGGDVYTYLNACKTISGLSGKEPVSLDKNFRSSREIIAGLNIIFQHPSFFPGKIRFSPVTCGKPDVQHQDHTGGKAIHLLQFDAIAKVNVSVLKESFADAIASEIKGLLNTQENPFQWWDETIKHHRSLTSKDICVLFRSKAEGLTLARHLRRYGVPYAFYKQSGLFQTQEAKEIYDLLNAVHEPNRSNRFKAWLTRFFNVPLKDLEHYHDVDVDHPYVLLLNRWHHLSNQGKFKQLFESILSESELFQRELFLTGEEREITNYDHIFEILSRLINEQHLSLQEVLFTLHSLINGTADPGQENDLLRLESDQQAVQLMTMHASKGLEFPVVFIYGGFSLSDQFSRYFLYHQDEQRIIDLSKENKGQYQIEQKEEDQRLLYVALTRAQAKLYLPYVPFLKDQAAKNKRMYQVSGTYQQILSSLDEVVAELSTEVIDTSEIPSIFSRTLVTPVQDTLTDSNISTLELDQALGQWEPALPLQPNRQLPVDELKEQCKAFTISSYSRMTRHMRFEYLEKVRAEKEAALLDSSLPAKGEVENDLVEEPFHALDKQLPPGIRTGNFLHEVLEKIDLSTLSSCQSMAAWLENPRIPLLFEELLAKYDFSHDYFDETVQMVWQTLTKPFPLSRSTVLKPLHTSPKYLREMVFYFPIPEEHHPSLAKLDVLKEQTQWDIKRGFLTGSIDFICEQSNKVYFMDWKSNLLPDYSISTLEQIVAEHYEWQLKIYTLVIVKWLQIRNPAEYHQRFGGLFYVFLRGIPEGKGIFFKMPAWEEVIEYEEQLKQQRY